MTNLDIALLGLRIVLGAIFLVHGFNKMGIWKIQPSEQTPAGMLRMMKFLSIVEPLGGAALILGFLTPYAAAGIGLVMLGAIKFKILKWKTPFTAMNQTGWEFDLVNLAVAASLVLLGGGQIALDTLL